MNPFTGNSNAFDYNVHTEWAPGFVSLLLYLFDFVNMDLFVVSETCCHPMCSVSLYPEDGERHVGDAQLIRLSL